MNVQLDNVLSDVMGKTGQLIVRAIVAVEQALERSDLLTRQVERAEARIDALAEMIDALAEMIAGGVDESAAALLAKPAATVGQRRRQVVLRVMLGVDLTAIPTIVVETALVIASEVAPDLSRFPSAAHFCSWLTLAPDTRISGGKQLRGTSPKAFNRGGHALRMAAVTARKSQSYIGACHRSRLRRLDAGRANKATDHQLARLVYAMLTGGEEYVAREIRHPNAKPRAQPHPRRRRRLTGCLNLRLGFVPCKSHSPTPVGECEAPDRLRSAAIRVAPATRLGLGCQPGNPTNNGRCRAVQASLSDPVRQVGKTAHNDRLVGQRSA